MCDAESRKCPHCGKGPVLPYSDNSKEGTPIRYKGWACFNCGRFVVMRGGDLYEGKLNSKGGK